MHYILIVLEMSLQNGDFFVINAAVFGFLFFKNLHACYEYTTTNCSGLLFPVLTEKYHGAERPIRKELISLIIIYNVELIPIYLNREDGDTLAIQASAIFPEISFVNYSLGRLLIVILICKSLTI